ncbi:dihydrofolate reductase family protein [Actinocrispum sp. NPDC049592]|uniref:dihydrofolate reductase family protein n=1 Tax=Actinocrispum sp. NPDC049592 TaxID=3154835 RepID=UPI00344164E9
MGRIVNNTYITLDGDITNMQDWHFDYMGALMDEARTQLWAAGALIMGRATYDGFAGSWPQRDGDFADRINGLKKYAVSTTLTDPEWSNTTVLSDNVVEQVRKIKEETEGNIVQYGFGSVTRLLLDAGLVDEVRLWLHPVLSGKAKPADLLYRDAVQTKFTLNSAEPHDNGVVILSYTPIG